MSFSFKIGCDPEVFFKKNGKGLSATETTLPGSKEAPYPTKYGAVQIDGLAGEINITPTRIEDFEGFNHNIIQTIKDLKTLSGVRSIAIAPVMEFDPEYLASLPKEALELGCDPDYNAYTLEENPRPDGTRNFRTGAGHIHIGWGANIPKDNPEHMEICASFIKMMDATAGMLMTVLDRDPRRRELYGKAGAFRPKSYGVEYRTPSNVWISHRDRRKAIHALTNCAITQMQRGRDVIAVSGSREETIREIIDTGNVIHAEGVLTYLQHFLPYDSASLIRRVVAEANEKAKKNAEE